MEKKSLPSTQGKLAEDFAINLLGKNGYKVIDRNFRSKFGEIDIVAIKDGVLVFVEVKARWSFKFGKPEEAVTPSKLWKIGRTGEYYSLLHPDLPKNLRIDVVALEIENGKLSTARIISVD
ncbi:MAG: YraN family protein [Candidatus Woesebacteria bacterium]|nr:YraN family protein [Candidatus Woesebacteria bacterium]